MKQNNLSKLDLFGREIKLTIDGSKEYKSAVGGCVTVLLMSGLGAYGLFLLSLMQDFEVTTFKVEE